MPVAPRLPTVSPATQTTTLASSAGATADAFGAPQGRAAQRFGQQAGQAGDTLSALALEQARDDNIRNAKQRDLEVAELIARVTRGDGTPDNPGYYSLNGEDAVRAHGQAAKDIDDGIAKIRGGITNQEAMDMFDAATGVRRQREFDSMAAHQQKGRADAEEMLSKARGAEALDYVMTHYPDDKAISQSVGVAVAEAVKQAKRAGADSETQAIVAQQAEAVIIRGAVIAALKGSDVARAQDILDKAKASGRLLGSTEAELDGMLKEVTDTAKVNAHVEDIFNDPSLTSDAQRFAVVRASVADHLQADVIAGLKMRRNEANAQREQSFNDASLIFTEALTAPGPGTTSQKLEAAKLANPDAWRIVMQSPAHHDNVIAVAQNMSNGSQYLGFSNGSTAVDITRLDPLTQRIMDLNKFKGSLTAEEFAQAVANQNGLRAAHSDDLKDAAPFTAALGIAKTVWESDWTDGSRSEDGWAATAALYGWVYQGIEAGTPRTPKEILEFAEGLRTPIRKLKSFLGLEYLSVQDMDELTPADLDADTISRIAAKKSDWTETQRDGLRQHMDIVNATRAQAGHGPWPFSGRVQEQLVGLINLKLRQRKGSPEALRIQEQIDTLSGYGPAATTP